ncbi:hypothetical protein QEH59_16870 [Coraliomargarita sp. SDUM461004]|uniref:Uncharacterized protein n=1 Tax=Thalassobacterium sedimentorum TaxID=3041258 RepID=A0ABU1AMU3_9BACT|nr:hypothetical protein [Coraliomargarita sp. SDUM461004]MDQ8196110.1 hypothetical protein [Coraliomargarita sp. SDUM461004]
MMKKISKWLGLLSLISIALVPIAYFFDLLEFSAMTSILFVATLLWYMTAFLWIGKPDDANLESDPIL